MYNTASVKNKIINIPGLSFQDKTFLLGSQLINGLPDTLQTQLLKIGISTSIKRKELLFMAGDAINYIYFIFSGKVKEYYTTETGEDCLRSILVPGSYISLPLVFSKQQTYSYTCEAVSEVRYFKWGMKDFMTILHREPSLGFKVSCILSCCIENSCRLQCLCRKTQAVSRVAGYLLRQCNPLYLSPAFHSKDKHLKFKADIRPIEQTASDICLARETFSRALSSLQKKNYILVKNGIVEILDVDALKEMSGVH